MSIPIIRASVDTTNIERAINLANDLIEKINTVKILTEEFNDVVATIDLKLGLSEQQEDA
jgi:hypothetical protein